MSKYLNIYILLTVYFSFGSSQKAILLSSSLGYYNYRQMSNIVKLYQNLRHNGFADDDILLMVGEMQPCCEKNHLFASLSFYDGDYTNIFRNVEVDYAQSQLTALSVSSILMGFYDRSTLNKQKLQLSESEPLFIYLTGHGGDKYFKIREK
jgi:phosphatidylinositol glycan class K